MASVTVTPFRCGIGSTIAPLLAVTNDFRDPASYNAYAVRPAIMAWFLRGAHMERAVTCSFVVRSAPPYAKD